MKVIVNLKSFKVGVPIHLNLWVCRRSISTILKNLGISLETVEQMSKYIEWGTK